ncbi:MAG: colanic acid biosynthesis acetyltransferase WcaF [Verrucomicrobiales bacterium]|nr:colanic acid biosynthesis acetyltransferase WcaF [Verrucomicrobiales bacterium]
MSRVSLKNYTATDYEPGPLVKRALWMGISRVFFETSIPWPGALQSSILRVFGAKIGDGVVFKPRVKIKYPWFLEIGSDSWIGEHSWIDNLAPVTLGESVVISQGAYLCTGNHDYKDPGFALRLGAIEVKDGAWIAANATVCPGVEVADSAILAVGSVASGNLEANSIYRGNPAAKVGRRFSDLC